MYIWCDSVTQAENDKWAALHDNRVGHVGSVATPAPFRTNWVYFKAHVKLFLPTSVTQNKTNVIIVPSTVDIWIKKKKKKKGGRSERKWKKERTKERKIMKKRRKNLKDDMT